MYIRTVPSVSTKKMVVLDLICFCIHSRAIEYQERRILYLVVYANFLLFFLQYCSILQVLLIIPFLFMIKQEMQPNPTDNESNYPLRFAVS